MCIYEDSGVYELSVYAQRDVHIREQRCVGIDVYAQKACAYTKIKVFMN